MSSNSLSPEHHSLKIELINAREQLAAALDQYAVACWNIRNTHHQGPFKDSQLPGFPPTEVDFELPFILPFKTKLHDATHNLTRAYELGQARSDPAYPPPIDKLPDEILTEIFRLTVAIESRDIHITDTSSTSAFPRCPDLISQTCARWRQLASACSSLWMDIYLAFHPTRFHSVLERAKTYSHRSGHLPLELHLTGLGSCTFPDLDSYLDNFDKFLSSVAHRIRSLEIIRINGYIPRIEVKAFTALLQGPSDVFTKLVVRSKGLFHPGFIDSREESGEYGEPTTLTLDLSREQIQRSLANLTVLHASHVYPRWTSTAYHGLVDLRLDSPYKHTIDCPRIKPSDFIAILKASPRLRILHFGIKLEQTPDDVGMNNVAVQLNDLEVLYLTGSGLYGPEDTEYEIKHMMQHIVLGSKPLRLTLEIAGYYDLTPLEAIKAFLSKSHTVKFCAKGGLPPPVELLDCAPHLAELVFDHCRYNAMYNFSQARSQLTGLDSWTIRGSPIFIEDLNPLVNQYSARSVRVSNCPLFKKGGGPGGIPLSEVDYWDLTLPDNAQYVNPDSLPDPTAGWNELE